MILLNDFESSHMQCFSRFIAVCYYSAWVLRPSDCSWVGGLEASIALSPWEWGQLAMDWHSVRHADPHSIFPGMPGTPTSQVGKLEWWSRSQSSGKEPAVKPGLQDLPPLVPPLSPAPSQMLFSSLEMWFSPSWAPRGALAPQETSVIYSEGQHVLLWFGMFESHQR